MCGCAYGGICNVWGSVCVGVRMVGFVMCGGCAYVWDL